MIMLPQGMRLGPYSILHKLGSGTSGEVYLAEDTRVQNRKVAIKVMQTEKTDFPSNTVLKKAVNAFQHEAQMVSVLGHHPNILPLYDYGEHEQAARNCIYTYLVMPYEKNGSLADWLDQHAVDNSNVLSPVEANDIVCMAADALQYAHDQNVIHRDVKPSNFLIGIGNSTTKLGNPHSPYILLSDFGTAKLSQGLVKTRVIGTPYFMAPEQWQGTCVPATDQYALAIMTFFLLTGEYPFVGSDFPELMNKHLTMPPPRPSAKNTQLPEQIDDVILRALAKNPQQRYPSITEFAQAFEKAAVIPVVPPTSDADSANSKDEDKKQFQQTDTIPARPNTRFSLVIVIALLLVTLLATSSGLFFYVQHRNINISNATATASTFQKTVVSENNATRTAQVNATATAQAHATATALTHATATAQVNATATALKNKALQAYPFALPSSEVINEQFKNDNFTTSNPNGWETHAGTTTNCNLTSQGYSLTDTISKTSTPCFADGTSFSNFTYQANLQITRGDCAGLIFRANNNNANYYIFSICTDGSYHFYNDANKQQTSIVNASSPNIRTALNAINIIAVVAHGSSIKFYINSSAQAVYTTTDTLYTNGEIGVIATDNTKPTTAIFLVAQVYRL